MPSAEGLLDFFWLFWTCIFVEKKRDVRTLEYFVYAIFRENRSTIEGNRSLFTKHVPIKVKHINVLNFFLLIPWEYPPIIFKWPEIIEQLLRWINRHKQWNKKFIFPKYEMRLPLNPCGKGIKKRCLTFFRQTIFIIYGFIQIFFSKSQICTDQTSQLVSCHNNWHWISPEFGTSKIHPWNRTWEFSKEFAGNTRFWASAQKIDWRGNGHSVEECWLDLHCLHAPSHPNWCTFFMGAMVLWNM